MSPRALACASACALVAGLAVAHQRPGLALTVALLLVLATVLCSRTPAAPTRRRRIGPAALAVAFAVQPALRDAGPVVAVGVVGALAASAWAATPLAGWRALARAAVATLRLDAGLLLVGRSVVPVRARLPRGSGWPAARAAVVALLVGGTFALLLGSADEAFADLAGDVLSARPDVGDAAGRAGLALLALATAGALAFGALRRPAEETPGALPPRAEAVGAVGAVVLVFAAFVVVQLRVLFGGPAYVLATTGLGYGEYARSGFVALLAATLLTLAVIAVAARRRERLLRGLLGVLCLLDLVVLASAAHRLGLVVDVYGLTRVRLAGFFVLAALAASLVAILAAGATRRTPPHAAHGGTPDPATASTHRAETEPAAAATPGPRWVPAALAAIVLVAGLGFCVVDPDRRVAAAAVDRPDADLVYVAALSADALPAVDAARRRALARGDTVAAGALARTADALRARLRRPDGLAGFNVARSRAR